MSRLIAAQTHQSNEQSASGVTHRGHTKHLCRGTQLETLSWLNHRRRECRIETRIRLVARLVHRDEAFRICATHHWNALLEGKVKRGQQLVERPLVNVPLRLATGVEDGRFRTRARIEDDRFWCPAALVEDDRNPPLVEGGDVAVEIKEDVDVKHDLADELGVEVGGEARIRLVDCLSDSEKRLRVHSGIKRNRLLGRRLVEWRSQPRFRLILLMIHRNERLGMGRSRLGFLVVDELSHDSPSSSASHSRYLLAPASYQSLPSQPYRWAGPATPSGLPYPPTAPSDPTPEPCRRSKARPCQGRRPRASPRS